MIKQEDILLLNKIRNNDAKAFELLFHRYYTSLCLFATNYTNNDSEAEEIVQDLFVRLWEKRDSVDINTSVKNYLFSSVKNQCLNLIQHKKIQNRHIQNVLRETIQNQNEEYFFHDNELINKVKKAISSLPEKRKKIFRMSREDGLKYHEIAKKMNISVKTVETQMGLALKTLRKKLKDSF